ncbi:hypothetical protein PHYPSEUDO_011131 [Phytophthora pseudosyringae]|uniref:Uncharacterized protein n=1 Tax=Phytophthora pseudosyringae TaxID=221518 RepID=A0A8T1V8S9_9STRA|nr:hypothetical protein PHYPSEUDO_011131 [Phytophthora pseudosyringae]
MVEVEVRVVRARVWLSSSLFLHQDGLLSLTRVSGSESVAHAALRSVEVGNGDQCSLEEVARQQDQPKCFRTVAAAWEEQGGASGSNCPKFSLPAFGPVEGDSQTRVRRKTHQQTILPRLDFQLFLLRPRSRGGASARSRQQTVVYIGTSGWQLSEKDVDALISSREVVFLTTLQGDLGTMEVKLRCVGPSDSGRSRANDRTVEDEADAPTGFRINWSSSEALQKDLAEKARVKADADKKLIVQLKQTATKEAKLVDSREYLLVHLHRSRAASRIQRRFRLLQREKREMIAKLRQEEVARIAVKKAKVRDKVVARNRERALAMRARLLGHFDSNSTSFSTRNARPEDPPSVQESKRIAEHMESERAKLKQRLAVLEMQRQDLVTSKRGSPNRSNQHSPQQKSSGKLFDDELVRAVQKLHFTHTQGLIVAKKIE